MVIDIFGNYLLMKIRHTFKYYKLVYKLMRIMEVTWSSAP